MKRFLFLIILSGCTGHSNQYPVADVPLKTAHAESKASTGATEDFSVLSGLLKNEIALTSSCLDLADKLVYQKRELGSEISLNECRSTASSVCPAADDETSHIFINHIAIKNSQGVDGVSILSVDSSDGLKQFVLAASGDVIEEMDARADSTSVISFTLQGDEISRIQNASKDMKEPLLLKAQSTFIPKDKKITRASRISQNDSVGGDLSIFEIEMPGEGIHIFTGTAGSCSYGFIGTDDSRREFGELNCQDKMKVPATIF